MKSCPAEIYVIENCMPEVGALKVQQHSVGFEFQEPPVSI